MLGECFELSQVANLIREQKVGSHVRYVKTYLLGKNLLQTVRSLDGPGEYWRGPTAIGLAAHLVALTGEKRLLQAGDAHTLGRH